ncbi:hypothetical protein F4811DRAFT_182179 [Daldinia bambusicola]|nr:hypothetical protein F4811DRAFT_182179 [Daldinia bambusicola]
MWKEMVGKLTVLIVDFLARNPVYGVIVAQVKRHILFYLFHVLNQFFDGIVIYLKNGMTNFETEPLTIRTARKHAFFDLASKFVRVLSVVTSFGNLVNVIFAGIIPVEGGGPIYISPVVVFASSLDSLRTEASGGRVIRVVFIAMEQSCSWRWKSIHNSKLNEVEWYLGDVVMECKM